MCFTCFCGKYIFIGKGKSSLTGEGIAWSNGLSDVMEYFSAKKRNVRMSAKNANRGSKDAATQKQIREGWSRDDRRTRRRLAKVKQVVLARQLGILSQ